MTVMFRVIFILSIVYNEIGVGGGGQGANKAVRCGTGYDIEIQ